MTKYKNHPVDPRFFIPTEQELLCKPEPTFTLGEHWAESTITLDELEESLKEVMKAVEKRKKFQGKLARAVLQILDDADYVFDPVSVRFRPRITR